MITKYTAEVNSDVWRAYLLLMTASDLLKPSKYGECDRLENVGIIWQKKSKPLPIREYRFNCKIQTNRQTTISQ